MSTKFGLLTIAAMIAWTANGQTYIGQILHRNIYQYAKLVCQADTCTFSIPYVDGAKTYRIPLTLINTTDWAIKRGAELWRFNTRFENGNLTGTLFLPTGQQTITFFEQTSPVEKTELAKYEGVFEDDLHRKVIIYSRFDYLHMMSPYSEETMSLKPLGENNFWSVSGEASKFSNLANSQFQALTISCRQDIEHHLHRVPSFTIEDLWIPIGEDTLFAQIFLPASKEQVPACLVLPGGGSVGMENYIYEARLFASHGVASLVFDKSGNGKSKGNGHFDLQSFEEKNEQYKTLFRYLQNHPSVDPQKTGVHGPSEGGRLALMMAIDLADTIAYTIASSGPFMTFREGQLYAMDQHHRNMGVKEVDNMHIRQIWNDYYTGIMAGKIDTALIEKANTYRTRNARLFLPPNTTAMPGSPRKEDIENDRVVQESGKITCPLLLQYGENDQRVNAQKSLDNLIPQLSDAGLTQTIFYKRGNHSIMTPEYQICTGYTSDKINWLKEIGIID